MSELSARPPPLASFTVDRERLVSLSNEILRSKLTLLVAPPGYGKTVLLGQWRKRLSGQARIINLDLTFKHNDPEVFRASLVSASHAELSLGKEEGGRVAPTDLTEFIDAIVARPQSVAPLIVILDNLERVNSSIVMDVLAAGLRLLPPSAHLVIASRVVPNLLLSEMRTQGQLCEISADDLAFSDDEVGALISSRDQHVLPQHTKDLTTHTMGWPAILEMALCSPADHHSPQQNHAIQDYFDEVVLPGLAEEDRVLLEETAVLSRLTPALVNQIVGVPAGAAARLTLLEHVGAVPLHRDTATQSWIIPSILRQHLLARLHRRDPKRYAELHSVASVVEGRMMALSKREHEVLHLLDGDRTISEVATELNVSFHTANSHVRSIYSKLGVSTRVLALQRSRESGLLVAHEPKAHPTTYPRPN